MVENILRTPAGRRGIVPARRAWVLRGGPRQPGVLGRVGLLVRIIRHAERPASVDRSTRPQGATGATGSTGSVGTTGLTGVTGYVICGQ